MKRLLTMLLAGLLLMIAASACADGLPVVRFAEKSGAVNGGMDYTLTLTATDAFAQDTMVTLDLGDAGDTAEVMFMAGQTTAQAVIPMAVVDTRLNTTLTIVPGEGYEADAASTQKLAVYTLPKVGFYLSAYMGVVGKQLSVQVQCSNSASVLKDNNTFQLRDQYGTVLGEKQWKDASSRLTFRIDITKELEGRHDLSLWLNGQCVTPKTGYCVVVDPSVKPLSTLDTNGEKYMSLTLDCGFYGDQTDAILAVLEKYNVKCTFFMTGYFLNNFPEEAKRIRDAGHEIGNHSYTHPRLLDIDMSKRVNEIVNTSRLCEKVLGITPRLFRPPYGNTDYTVSGIARGEGMEVTMWTIDSHDWDNNKTHAQVLTRIKHNVVPGSIILFHLDGFDTPTTLDEIIPYYTQELGMTLVPVTELMSHGGRELPPLPN